MRRALLAAALAAATLVPGCAKPKRVSEVVFWQYWPVETVTPLVRRFEADHPGVRVQLRQIDRRAGPDSVAAALAAGHPPDLCEVGSDEMPDLLASGRLSDWSAGVADLRDSLRGWDMCRLGDALYGMPWLVETQALYYNKALFARAGLDPAAPPATWEALAHAAARIQRLGHGVHGWGVPGPDTLTLFARFMPLAWSNGGGILTPALDSVCFDSPRNVEALDFCLRLRASGLQGTGEALDREFESGRLGLEIAGEDLLARLPREAPALRYGVALVPCPDADSAGHASLGGGDVLVSFTTSRRKEDALRLARFLVQRENALPLAERERTVQPANQGAGGDPLYASHPDERVLIRQFDLARFVPNHPRWDEMERIIDEEIGLALDDRKSAAQAVADAGTRLAELVGKK